MATSRKTTRRNVASGWTSGTGAGRVFHPYRSSPDYDPERAGESKPKKKRKPAKKAAAKKTVKKATTKRPAARKPATKRVAIKKRVVVRKRTLAKKRVVRGKNPPLSESTKRILGNQGARLKRQGYSAQEAWDWFRKYGAGPKNAAIRLAFLSSWNTVKRNPPHTVTLPVARHMGSLYAQQGLTKQSAWEKFLAWARTRTTAVSLPADSIKRQKIKEAFLKEYDKTKGLAKNPKSRKTAPRTKIGYSVALVGKSRYKATMMKAKSLMPFPNAEVVAGGDGTRSNTYYYLRVPAKNAATARSILNTMAKTMTKKATKKAK